ncbi:hypothetical protein CL614_01500 [archaeon]|nr:hypothetical protein [archaeon]|tara:strand:- start:38 stop:703 length:666 start_codon:yes stop_codon:yes gene_type:complete
MNQLITMVMVLFIGVIGIGTVLSIGNPAIKTSVAGGSVDEAKNILGIIDNAIMQVSEEGKDSSRLVSFYSNVDGFETLPNENAIQFDVLGNFMDYGSRNIGRTMVIAGDEVDCSVSDGNIIMENDKIMIGFKISDGVRDISEDILFVKNKILNITVPVLGLDIDMSGTDVTVGTGKIELLATGKSLPLCKTVSSIDTGDMSYKVVYTLYTGADFVVVDVIQ